MQDNVLDIGRAGWGADYNDADNFLTLLKTGVQYNYGRYSNAEFDALLDEANATTDLSARSEILRKAETIALRETASIPIYYNVARNMVSPKVEGFVDNAFDIHRTRWLSISE